MKNVTITMEDDVLGWVRVEAAKRGESVSRYMAALIREKRQDSPMSQLESLERFLSGPGFPGAAAAWPGREALYAEREDDLLRRHEHPDLRRGSEGDR